MPREPRSPDFLPVPPPISVRTRPRCAPERTTRGVRPGRCSARRRRPRATASCWSDLARRLAACALTGPDHAELIPLNTCYVAAVPTEEEAERLTAWLNSTWVRAIAQLHAVPASGGFHRFTAAVVRRLPLPATVLTDDGLLAAARAARRGEAIEEAIDDLTAEHLALSPRDRSALARLVATAAAHRR